MREKWQRIKYDLLVLKAEAANGKDDKASGKAGEEEPKEYNHQEAVKSFRGGIIISPSGCIRPTATSCWRCT